MLDIGQQRRNSALWTGLLLTVAGLLSNGLYFARFPAVVVPWLTLALLAMGLMFAIIGVTRAFGKPQIYSGRISGSVITLIALFIFAATLWVHIHVRELPRSQGAPQVGQTFPDFTLPDSTGQPVSLSQLFSAPAEGPQSKAVLLVFYRGYW